MAEAFAFAHALHHGQTRKGTQTPYFTHLLAVAGLVGEFGGDEDQICAALLHDSAEDQGGEKVIESIRDRFGAHVAKLVEACSDTFESPKPPWKQRKLAYITHLADVADAARLIIAADKLHNVRSICADYRIVGDRLWDRFSASREDTIWYYAAVREALERRERRPILVEYAQSLLELQKCRTI